MKRFILYMAGSTKLLLSGIAMMCLIIAPVAEPGTLFDDFSDGNFEGWRETWMQLNQATWQVESGILIGDNPADWSNFLVVGDNTWQDYEIECDTRIVSVKNTIPSVGIGLRHSGQNGAASQTLAFALVAQNNILGPEGAYAVYLGNNSVGLRKIEAMPVEVGRWYHIKESAQDNHFEFHVDGDKVIDIHDDTLTSGAVGLEAHAGVSQYDNVVITGDDIPGLNLSVTPQHKLVTTWAQIRRQR